MTEDQGQPSINPAWNPLLEKLPDELHGLILPTLQEWDKGVQDKLQSVRNENPYLELGEYDIPMDRIKQALYLAQQIEENPNDVAAKMIESFGLDYIPKSAIPDPSEPDDMDYDLSDLNGLENHPAYKAILEKVENANRFIQEREEQEQEEQDISELEEFLEAAHEQHGDFNDLFVTALMAQGMDAEDAIQQYKDVVGEALKAAVPVPPAPQIPVVMGGTGNSGSGMPDQPVPMGSLKKQAINDLAIQFLEQNQGN